MFHIIQADATLFNDYSKYNYFYLYNPFDGGVLKIVLDKIISTLEDNPRKIVIIYKNPLHKRVIEATEHFEEIYNKSSVISKILKQEIIIYESK